MANNFPADSNCVAVCNFNNAGAPLEDSIGANDLSNGAAYPTRTTTGPLEGAASMDFEASSSQYLTIADASLSSDFPGKNGTSNNVFSFTAKIKLESTGAQKIILSKYNTSGKRTFAFSVESSNKLSLRIGYNSGDSNEFLEHATELSSGTNYLCAVSFNNSTRAYAVRVRTLDGSVVGTDLTGTATNTINIEDSDVLVGAYLNAGTPAGFFDGYLDEIAVFKDILTADEVSAIAAETYLSEVIKSVSDGGSGSDAPAQVAVSMGVVDAGAAGEAFASGAACGLVDTGIGIDALSPPSVSLVLVDSGASFDLIALLAAFARVIDVAAGVEAIGPIDVQIGLSDAGAGVDVAGSYALIRVSDQGAAADLISQIAAALSVSDSGAGADALAGIIAEIAISDAGAGIDSISVLTAGGELKTIYDSGAGSDMPGVMVALALADAGTAADVISQLAARLFVTDAGAGSDAIGLAERLSSIIDAGAGSDAPLGITVSLNVSDSGVGADLIAQIMAALSVTDAGAGSDLMTVITSLAHGKVRITITAKRPGASITSKRPHVTIH